MLQLNIDLMAGFHTMLSMHMWGAELWGGGQPTD